ncbi:MAG: hypothetical protein MUP74_03380 [Desulfobacterales bacterium]|nr:hypothetical protein [Desulfobacterales bacterium]
MTSEGQAAMRYRQLTLICAGFLGLCLATAVSSPPPDKHAPGTVFVPGPDPAVGALITPLEPEARGGEAYRLVYRVDVPVEVLWRFKTDFSGNLFSRNRYIQENRLIRREENAVITEQKLSATPGVTYRWRTTLSPGTYRLDFELLNPVACGQKFHYGFIQLQGRGASTQVTQVAYFDFFGAYLWANFPWKGGMTSFLNYFVRWERETVHEMREQYER